MSERVERVCLVLDAAYWGSNFTRPILCGLWNNTAEISGQILDFNHCLGILFTCGRQQRSGRCELPFSMANKGNRLAQTQTY